LEQVEVSFKMKMKMKMIPEVCSSTKASLILCFYLFY